MPKLSVVIITYNEERNIGRCLESVKDIADDMVVVDSYSTDDTEKIVRSFGARFIPHPFEGHIEQKNWAISQAKYPHILSLDADECLSEELKNSIKAVKKEWKYDGYYFNRLTNYCGKWIKHTSWYPARKLRLWDSRKGRWGGMNPHDRFYMDKGTSRKFLKGDLLHYSYFSINEHIEQINKFSSIVARAYYNAGKRANIFNIILNPIWRMFRDYIIKFGFLDGFYGLVVSVNSAHETFLKYIKLRKIYREKSKSIGGTDRLCFMNSVMSWGGGEKWHYDVCTKLSSEGYDVFMVTNVGSELFNRIQNRAVRTYQLRINNLSFLNPYKIWRLYRIFKREGVKTVIINLSSDLKAGGIAARLAGVKNIVYRRGSAIPIRNTFLNRFLFRRIVSRLIANSQETKRTVLANNPNLFDMRKILVIYNGIELHRHVDHFPAIERSNNELILGNAGRLSEEKGQSYLIDLARILKKSGMSFKIYIAGTGRLKNKLQKMIHQYKLEKYVILLGFVHNIRSFNRDIDIFLLTSLWEGFGYVMVEAMAEAKPVVAFDIKSSSEIVQEGMTGYLVETGNIQAMAQKIIELDQDRKMMERLGQNGKARVEAIFTLDQTIAKVKDLLHEMGQVPVSQPQKLEVAI